VKNRLPVDMLFERSAMRTLLAAIILSLLAASADAGPFRRARQPQGYVLTPGHPVNVVVQPRPFYPPLPYPNQGYPTQGYIAPPRPGMIYFVPFGSYAGGACGR
jgi:hypothetical protein